MDDLQSEKEQLEEMRAWWTVYGRYVIAGVVIAVGLLFGFNQYQSSKLAAQVEASVLYESLTVYVSDGDLDNAESVADDLASNYANTAYAAQSNLAMAKLYMDKNRDQDAADVLNELLLMRGNKALKQIGRLRLARILLYQDKPQDVVDLLADQDEAAFAGLFAEMRGDAFAALGQITAAGDEYRTALADTSQTINRGVVQMKLVDLPDVPAPAPAVTEPEQQAEQAVEGEGGESE
ncbi:MAG: tetratricopeptide repeat protein [Woeseiaceae bacterium]|nr:tetratricopeptide repeat protein [Woeseiaceae bacterium]MDX2608723.1 tetratricopeptide repeat protein [Woeseiaceae bacterium]